MYDNNSEILSVFLLSALILLCLFVPSAVICCNNLPRKSIRIFKRASYVIIKLHSHSIEYIRRHTTGKLNIIKPQHDTCDLSYTLLPDDQPEEDINDEKEKSQCITVDNIIKYINHHYLANKLYIASIFLLLISFIILLLNAKPYWQTGIKATDYLNCLYIVIFAVSLVYGIYHIMNPVILEYRMSEAQQLRYTSFINALNRIFSCSCVRESTKQTGLLRISKLTNRIWFKPNIDIFSMRTTQGKILFLPDRLYVIGGKMSRVYDYNNIKISCSKAKITEYGITYPDEEIVGKAWEHQTKSGKPDLRYKDNPSYNVCLCGEVTIDFGDGHSIVLVTSNHSIIDDLQKEP